jgi:hypothetical protein
MPHENSMSSDQCGHIELGFFAHFVPVHERLSATNESDKLARKAGG